MPASAQKNKRTGSVVISDFLCGASGDGRENK